MTSSPEANEIEKTCGDINECEANPCDEVTQICQNSAGSFKCECRLGFENIAQGTGPACQDINGNHKKLISLINNYDFQRNFIEFSECEMANNCSLNSKCVNSFGSYSCSCLPGYKKNEQLQSNALESQLFFDKCVDIDECEAPALSCPDANSYCVNLDGSFECPWLRGFMWSADSGNGAVWRTPAL